MSAPQLHVIPGGPPPCAEPCQLQGTDQVYPAACGLPEGHQGPHLAHVGPVGSVLWPNKPTSVTANRGRFWAGFFVGAAAMVAWGAVVAWVL